MEFKLKSFGQKVKNYFLSYETKNIPYELIPSEFLYAFILGMYDGDGGLTCSADFSKDVTI